MRLNGFLGLTPLIIGLLFYSGPIKNSANSKKSISFSFKGPLKALGHIKSINWPRLPVVLLSTPERTIKNIVLKKSRKNKRKLIPIK